MNTITRPTFTLPPVSVERSFQRSPIGLGSLLGPETIEPGFYPVAGGREELPALMDGLVGFLDAENKRLASSRSHGAHSFGQFVPREIGKIIWIDSGNYFDPYHIARMAVRRGMDPWRTLRSIQVARPFTAFQFKAMLDKVPAPSILNVKGRNGDVTRIQRVPLVVLSDLTSLFYDPEIQEMDVRRAFRDFQVALSLLKKKAIVVGLQMSHVAPASREAFLSRLRSMATQTLSLARETNSFITARSA